MTKRIIAITLALLMFGTTVFASVSFSDLPENHWGYLPVSKLVNDGTVKGYEDGSFRPANPVTRAEFVKMMGIGPVRKEADYLDVDSSHWGYEYIMTSGFEAADNNFLPSKPITRGEAIELLWKRQGAPVVNIAPQIISEQSTNKNAVNWAYNNKIMVGDDGVNLRFGDNISRVEAAALIIRTRETDYSVSNIAYKDIVSDNTLRTVFESFDLFDKKVEYNPVAKITNGELAKAAMRIAAYEKNLTYKDYNISAAFEHPYGKDVTVIASKVLGESFATKEFADKNALIGDAVAVLTFAALEKSYSNIVVSSRDSFYPDVEGNVDLRKNTYLSFANTKGIQLNSNGTIGANIELTHKDFALILLQLDNLIGTQTVYSTKKENGSFVRYDAKLNNNYFSYPQNAASYACIIDGVENSVYERTFTSKTSTDEMFSFSREFSEMFVSVLTKLVDAMKKGYNVDSELIVYPNLIWDSGKGFSMRLKCKILSVPSDNVDIKEMFGSMLISDVSGNLKEGMEFFIETSVSYGALIGM
ncbi:MAG: S-layer homology domain-containing protein [Ruminococcaceae bacterium]|nr:S-layer homology domain-containing protein [Oscillospiraceae bacterium]